MSYAKTAVIVLIVAMAFPVVLTYASLFVISNFFPIINFPLFE